MAVQRLSNSGRSGFSYKSLIAGITPLPSVPTIGSATAVNYASVNVAFTAPGDYSGVTYTATSNPGGFTGTSASSPILVSGLSELTAYTFTVTATNATGTSGASAASDAVTTPSGDTGVMYPIQMVSVGAAGTSSITFSSIPSTYTHLQIRGIARGTAGAWNYLSINGNTTSGNYYAHELTGNGSSAFSNPYTGTSDGIQLLTTYGHTNVFSGIIIDILNYTSTNKNKTIRCLNGWDNNGAGEIRFSSGLFSATPAAVTSIKLTCGNTYQQYTQFALYGIKGA